MPRSGGFRGDALPRTGKSPPSPVLAAWRVRWVTHFMRCLTTPLSHGIALSMRAVKSVVVVRPGRNSNSGCGLSWKEFDLMRGVGFF